MNDSVATETTELGSIPPTVVYATPKREEEVMASRTQIHNTKNNNMPNNQKRMRPNVNGENSLALGKPQSPGRVMHVANLRIPLPRSMVTGKFLFLIHLHNIGQYYKKTKTIYFVLFRVYHWT